MKLADALNEFLLAHDYSPATVRTYRERLRQFQLWCESQQPAVTTVEAITTPLVRKFIDERRTMVSVATGRPLDSFTLNTHARSVLAWLNWLVAEGELAESVPRRIKPPRREQKLMHVLDKRQIDRLFLAAGTGPTSTRDTAIIAVLLVPAYVPMSCACWSGEMSISTPIAAT